MRVRPRLLVLAQAAHRLGGVPIWLSELLPRLAERGWKVRLGLVASEQSACEGFLREHPSIMPFAFPVCSTAGTHQGRRRAIRAAVRRLQPALVLVCDVAEAYEEVLALRAAKTCCARVLMALHGLHPGYFADLARFRDSLDGVVCSNRLTERLVGDFAGIPQERVFYAPYGVAEGCTRDEKRGEPGRLRVGWVGRLDQEQKRCLDLAEIARELTALGTPFDLLVVGTGGLQENLVERLESSGERRRVHLTGAISRDEVASRIYSTIDALLVTSAWETGPIVAWEAMAHGVPVVTSRYVGSGLEGSLRPGDNCLQFEIGDTAGAAREITRLGSAALRRQLSSRANKLVAARYSLAASVEGWEAALTTLVTRDPLPGIARSEARAAAGRLDRWFGVVIGDRLRAALAPLRGGASGQEPWPFSLGGSGEGSAFWRRAAEADGRQLPEQVLHDLVCSPPHAGRT